MSLGEIRGFFYIKTMQIKNLTLYTHKLTECKHFYANSLKLPITEVTNLMFTAKIGSTHVTFKETSRETYYHFAINIPSFHIEDAYNWLSPSIHILPFLGNEIVDFNDWNARAIYFYDPAGNIVELIARKNLNIQLKGAFTPNAFLHISEIGLPVANVQKTYDLLNQHYGLERYSGDYTKFCAIGEETGLFIVIDHNQKDWIPNQDKALPFPFEIEFNHNQMDRKLVYTEEKLKFS